MSPELEDRFQELASLPVGWNFGHGCGSAKEVQERARCFANSAESMDNEVSIFPEEGGGILVSLGLYEFLFLPGEDSLIEVTYDLDHNYYKHVTDEGALLFLIFGPSSLDK